MRQLGMRPFCFWFPTVKQLQLLHAVQNPCVALMLTTGFIILQRRKPQFSMIKQQWIPQAGVLLSDGLYEEALQGCSTFTASPDLPPAMILGDMVTFTPWSV
jgi:hypothetical protein